MAITVRVQNYQSIADATVELKGLTVVTGTNNAGKALLNGTKVATPNGWRLVESLCVGDSVFAGNGTVTTVLGVFPQGVKDTCTITFDDGREVTTDLEHQWRVSVSNGRFEKPQRWEVATTKQLWDRVGSNPKGAMRPAIPRAGAVQYPHRDVPLDPYLLGVLLGDGNLHDHGVRVCLPDEGVRQQVAASLGDLAQLQYSSRHSYRIRTDRGKPNPVLDALRGLGLSGVKSPDKFIPEGYLRNSVGVRIALLQGILDTDGGVTRNGTPEFYTSSKRLMHDVKELLYSLGAALRVRTKRGKYRNNQGEAVQCHTAYTIVFRLPDVDVFRLRRKSRLVKELTRRVQPLMVGFRKSDAAPCTCIAVACPTKTFQIEGHLVTHNSALMRAISGVFTNARGTHFVRHGAKSCKVTITFPDGNTVTWEKGKGINRYVLNGKEFNRVGHGVPDEVAALGIRPVTAGTETYWPQIGKQVKGQVFLVDRSGSQIAEVVADVDRVGECNAALRAVEKDRRSNNAALKIRKEDLKDAQDKVAKYAGLDAALDAVRQVQDDQKVCAGLRQAVINVTDLRDRRAVTDQAVSQLKGCDTVKLPSATGVDKVRKALGICTDYKDRRGKAQQAVSQLKGVADIVLPDPQPVVQLQASLGQATALRDKRVKVTQQIAKLSVQSVDLSGVEASVARVEKASSIVRQVKALTSQRGVTMREREDLAVRLDQVAVDISNQQKLRRRLLAELGYCPTCERDCAEPQDH